MEANHDAAASIRTAARSVADNLMTYYHGNQTGQIPGILPGPPPGGDYYWWEGGALWGTLVDYWHYTNDTTYNDVVQQALIFQSDNSYMPGNWSLSMGNDDQGFWGMSAMLAAETTFENPAKSQPQWLALAQAVFNTQAAPDRHDGTCGGGLRWQIFPTNNGYGYKNSIANGVFFNIGARLARYTGNDTYAAKATQTWDWLNQVGFMNSEYDIFDGANVDTNCTDLHKEQFTYNAAIYLQGAAFMYDYVSCPATAIAASTLALTGEQTNGSAIWKQRVTGLLNRTLEVFFTNGVPVEISCELADHVQCKTDMFSFKGFLLRWMASTAQLAPFTHSIIMPVLKSSAAAAIKSCNGNVCGFRWTTGSYDGSTGAGQQMNVVAALSALLVDGAGIKDPVTASTGGTSEGNANAGTSDSFQHVFAPVTTADRAGAGILTLLTLAGVMATTYWLNTGMSEGTGKWYRPFP